MERPGHFVISLDFEIFWGVWDVISLDKYKEHLLGVRQVIPGVIRLFKKYDTKATFATVGFLFFENRSEMMANLPVTIPTYKDEGLSPYINHFDQVGENEKRDPFHFAPSLIQLLKESGQEIGCHTFCHYYCLEEGQILDQFRDDLRAAKQVASKWGIELKSFVFPRNQYNEEYIQVCREEGITSFRGNENSWLYNARDARSETLLRRAFRLIDSYINISGHHCYSEDMMKKSNPVNIPSSRFLRQYKKRFSFLEGLRLARIKNSMTFAAKNKLTYHLWWHPHNFGTNLENNLSFLEKILQHYKKLEIKFEFKSTNMQELARQFLQS